MTTANAAHRLPPCEYVPPAYGGPSRQEVLAARRQFCNPALIAYYQEPLMIVDGHMQYLFDETGRRYLDFFAGIVTVSCGHCHPKIIARTRRQIERLQHTTTIYLNPNLTDLAAKLASKMPPGLEVTYFVNSGSEANDLAVTMARLFTGHHDVMALENAYHGGTSSTLELTSLHSWKYPLPQGGVHHVACPDPYRSQFSGTGAEVAEQTAENLLRAIRFRTSGQVAAFIAEPIQGVGGITSGPESFFRKAYRIVREHGGLCIADEVQTGFGRTGDHYWGFENFDVVPDIVTMAKGLGNGVPLAAVTTRREIAEVLARKLHLNTFGGNPVSMAQGSAVLDVIEEDGLQENARIRGAQLKAGLDDLMKRHPLIGDVRGRGLMLGVELVEDRRTKTPAAAGAVKLHEALREAGLLVGRGGLYGNVLRIQPPLCIVSEDVDYALRAFDETLGKVG